MDVKSRNIAWIAAFAGSASITNSYYDNSADEKEQEDPAPEPPAKTVSTPVERPVPTVKLKPNKQLWLSFKGKLAYWDSATASADSGSPTKKVESGSTDIHLSDYFDRPTVASPTTTAKTFSLAVGDYDAHAVGREKVWFTVTLPGKTYSAPRRRLKRPGLPIYSGPSRVRSTRKRAPRRVRRRPRRIPKTVCPGGMIPPRTGRRSPVRDPPRSRLM